jgi:hypothetical protein
MRNRGLDTNRSPPGFQPAIWNLAGHHSSHSPAPIPTTQCPGRVTRSGRGAPSPLTQAVQSRRRPCTVPARFRP